MEHIVGTLYLTTKWTYLENQPNFGNRKLFWVDRGFLDLFLFLLISHFNRLQTLFI